MTAPAPAESEAPAAILAAATDLFAAQGFSGVTIKEIAAKAKVNSALLYYYYEDKEGLYRACLRHIVGSISQQIGGSIAVVPSPEIGVRTFVAKQAEHFFGNRNFSRLILRELFDGGTVRLEVPMTTVVTNALRPLMQLIIQGQKSGVFRADVDPRLAAISTISQVAYFTIAHPIVTMLLGPDAPPHAEMVRQFGEHAGEWAIRALKA
jgi:TetR/AcrR family transcriptional regulator